MVFVDFDSVISGSMEVSGARSHAGAIIERKLSVSGDVDGPAHVILHQVTKLASGHRVFFSAVPRSELGSLSVWARNQKGNVLVVDIMSLLWNRIKESEGVVSQIGRRLFFLAKYAGQTAYASTVAFSEVEDDLKAARQALIERVQVVMTELTGIAANRELKIQWAPILARRAPDWRREDELAVAENFLDSLAVTGELVEFSFNQTKDGKLVSVLPFWVTRRVFSQSISTVKDRALWLAGAYLREWMYCALFLAFIGLVYASALYIKTRGIERETARMGDVVTQMNVERHQLEPKASLPDGFENWTKLINAQHTAVRQIDLNHVMNVVGRAAADSGVRVMRVYTIKAEKRRKSKEQEATRIGVDGMLPSREGVSETSELAKFVSDLRDGGYQVSSETATQSPNAGGQSGRMFSYALQATDPIEVHP
ncbi:hypothetical protein WJ39_17810 [Burkholderia diffusa]|nr:hypothetical protein WJ39_17810 [Burkholderia diffusa]